MSSSHGSLTTPQEVRDLRLVFDAFDPSATQPSGSGSIDRDSLRRAIKVLGFRVSRASVEELARETDVKGSGGWSGSVSFECFLQIVEKLQGESYDTHGELVQAFHYLMRDVGDQEALSVKTLRGACSSVGLKVTEAQLQGMMEEADLNGDGRISQEEFITVMLRTNLFK